MNLIEKTKTLTLHPLRDISSILALGASKQIYFFPIVYCMVVGISKYLSMAGMTFRPHLFIEAFTSTFILLLGIFIFCFIYSCIVWFISVSLKGIASVGMIFTLAFYSLTPMIMGAVIILLLKIIWFSSDFLIKNSENFTLFIFFFQYVFIIWSICVFIIGNKVLNQFSIMKSIISSIGLLVIFAIVVVYQKLT
jgi:hypothetical protein